MMDFFWSASNQLERTIVLGIYQGMVKMKGVRAELLANCLQTNRLNQLVHAKYRFGKTQYYMMFINSDIDLTPRVKVETELPREQWMTIYDDDHCPNCEAKGYITRNNRDGFIDCSKCYMLMCKYCHGERSKCQKCVANGDPESGDDDESTQEEREKEEEESQPPLVG